MGLPQHIHELSLGFAAAPKAAPSVEVLRPDGRAGTGGSRLYAVVTPHAAEGSFDAEVIDTAGNKYLRLRGYRTVALPSSVDGDVLKALREAALAA
jgi:hypothetical protein